MHTTLDIGKRQRPKRGRPARNEIDPNLHARVLHVCAHSALAKAQSRAEPDQRRGEHIKRETPHNKRRSQSECICGEAWAWTHFGVYCFAFAIMNRDINAARAKDHTKKKRKLKCPDLVWISLFSSFHAGWKSYRPEYISPPRVT